MEDILEMRWMKPKEAVFQETSGGFVSLDYQGKHYDRIGVYRMFPNSKTQGWLSIREADEKAAEIGMILELKEFDKETQRILERQLKMRYFTPKIESFTELKEEYGYLYITAMTDCGICRFTVRTGGGNIAQIATGRYRITDIDGNRYEVPDIDKLPAKDLRKFELYI